MNVFPFANKFFLLSSVNHVLEGLSLEALVHEYTSIQLVKVTLSVDDAKLKSVG